MAIEKHLPFERIFGNTAELRVIEFLLSLKDIMFSVDELSELTDTSIHALCSRVIPRLLTFEVLKSDKKSNGNYYYGINSESVIIKSLETIDNDIIEHLLTDEENAAVYEVLHNDHQQSLS